MSDLEYFRVQIDSLAKNKGWSDDMVWLELGLYKEVGELVQAIEHNASQVDIGNEFADVMHFLLQLMTKKAPAIDLNNALTNKIISNGINKKKTYKNGVIVEI